MDQKVVLDKSGWNIMRETGTDYGESASVVCIVTDTNLSIGYWLLGFFRSIVKPTG